MADLQTLPAPDQRTTDHTRPLDTVLVAVGETQCGTCQAILHMLKAHLEINIPAWPKGGMR